MDYYAQGGVAVDPNRLLLTASTSEAYALLFKLLCDPGDAVLVPRPSYPLFEYLAALECVQLIPYELRYDGAWSIDFGDMRLHIAQNVRAIVVVNPNNPTGSFLKEHEFVALSEIALQHKLPVISDEVFADYALSDSPDPVNTFIGRNEILSFSLNGLSKTALMPQMKLAWIAINGPNPDYMASRNRLELLSDTYLSVSTPVQYGLAELLKIGADLRIHTKELIRENLYTLDRTLQGVPAHLLHLEGGWSAILRLPNIFSEEIWTQKLLEEYDTIVQPGFFFDMNVEPTIVVSLMTPSQEFAPGLSRIVSCIKNAGI